jgi:ABC-type Fe3+ transport system substrate-binding protein
MWADWCQPMCSASYNTKSVPNGMASYADAWDKNYNDKIVMISMRVTQAIAPLVAAASLATGKPLAAAMKEWQAGFEKLKELKPNILQVSTQMPQAQQLLESGECDLFLSPDSRSTLFRKGQGAPVDQAYPKEGLFAMPVGVALVRGGPNVDLGIKFINELLDPQTQAVIAKTFTPADQFKAVLADGLKFPASSCSTEYFTNNRAVDRRFEKLRQMNIAAASRTLRRPGTSRSIAPRSRFGNATVLSDLALGRAAVSFAAQAVRLRQDHAAAHHRGTVAPDTGSISIAGRELTASPRTSATSASCSRATRSFRT